MVSIFIVCTKKVLITVEVTYDFVHWGLSLIRAMHCKSHLMRKSCFMFHPGAIGGQSNSVSSKEKINII